MQATWADVAKLPEHLVGEIVDRELIVTRLLPMRAAHVHSVLLATIGRAYDLDRRGTAAHWWILTRMESHLGDDVLTPDIGGWRSTTMPGVPDGYPDVPPDWICEVLTPETEAYDRGRKLDAWARHGVRYASLADDEPRIEVLQLVNGRWEREGVFDTTIRAEPFSDLEIDLGSFWR